MTESYGPIMVEASRRGHRLWRNNVALITDSAGNVFRGGLARKSSDLIGLRAGDGKFLSIEVKPAGWRIPRPPSTTRSVLKAPGPSGWGEVPQVPPLSKARQHYEGQLRWIEMVRSLGGLAGFARGVDEAMAIIEGLPDKLWLGGDATWVEGFNELMRFRAAARPT